MLASPCLLLDDRQLGYSSSSVQCKSFFVLLWKNKIVVVWSVVNVDGMQVVLVDYVVVI